MEKVDDRSIAVPFMVVRASVKPDFIVCLECGRKGKMLRRHIATAHGLDEDAYREKCGLAKSYPMTAPNYPERRKALIKELGLGTKARRGGRKLGARSKK